MAEGGDVRLGLGYVGARALLIAVVAAACTAAMPPATRAPYTVPPDAGTRFASRAEYDRLVLAVNSDGHTFGGSYFDDERGLTYHIGVVAGADPAKVAVISALMPVGGNVKTFSVVHSMNSLVEVRDALMARARGAFSYLAIDERNNRITVAPLPGKEADIGRVAAEFGQVVHVEPGVRILPPIAPGN